MASVSFVLVADVPLLPTAIPTGSFVPVPVSGARSSPHFGTT